MRFVSDSDQRDLSNSNGLQVIAAGLPRAATSSLQSAFENDLDLAPCMHMAYIAPHVEKLKLLCEALRETDKFKRQKILKSIFDGYRASADFPGFLFVNDLIEIYPDVQIVLNKRNSAENWMRSFNRNLRFFSTKTYFYIGYLWPTDYWHYQVHQAAAEYWKRLHGLKVVDGGPFVLETFEKHHESVREIAKAHGKEVLEWQPEQGWEPLCKLLGKPVPDKKFPHLNDERFMTKLKIFLVVRGLVSWTLAVASGVGLWFWVKARFQI